MNLSPIGEVPIKPVLRNRYVVSLLTATLHVYVGIALLSAGCSKKERHPAEILNTTQMQMRTFDALLDAEAIATPNDSARTSITSVLARDPKGIELLRWAGDETSLLCINPLATNWHRLAADDAHFSNIKDEILIYTPGMHEDYLTGDQSYFGLTCDGEFVHLKPEDIPEWQPLKIGGEDREQPSD